MKKYNYKQHRLSSVQDIDTIVEAIHQNGNFTSEDYNYLYTKAINSRYPTRLTSRLNKYVEPLICVSQKPLKKVVNEAPIVKEEEESPISPFERTYKASDFLVTDGCIQLGKWKLKSVRIPSTSPSILAGIDHDFVIAPEALKPDAFHFVPYTDLGFLLDAIEEQIQLEAERQEQQEIEKLKQLLPEFIDDFIFNYRSQHMRGFSNFFRYSYEQVNKVLKRAYLLTDDMDRASYDSLYHECDVQVPIEDIVIEDGFVTVDTQRLSVSRWRDLSISNFISRLRYTKYSDFAKLDEDFLNDCLNEHIEAYLHSLPKNKVIRIQTYLSRKRFENTFLREECFQSDENSYGRCKVEYFSFPSSYLTNDFNDGLLLPIYAMYLDCNLYNINFEDHLFNMIATESSIFSEKVMKEFDELLAKIPKSLWDLLDMERWINRGVSAQKLTDFFIERLPLYIPRTQITRAFIFTEDFTHASDEWSTLQEKSYLLIDDHRHTITLYPTSCEYSDYTFFIDTSIASLDVAALVIIKYFSSTLANKRQGFKVTDQMKYFGIQSVCKYRGRSAVCYREKR